MCMRPFESRNVKSGRFGASFCLILSHFSKGRWRASHESIIDRLFCSVKLTHDLSSQGQSLPAWRSAPDLPAFGSLRYSRTTESMISSA